MIDRLYLVSEIIAVLLCLHGLYGEKFGWNIYTILLIGIEFVVYQMNLFWDRDAFLKIFVGILIYIYSIVRFRKTWKCNLLNCILCIVIASVMQLICYFPVMIWHEALAGIINDVVNVLFLCLIFILYKSQLLYRISMYMQQKGKVVAAFSILSAVFIFYTMYKLGVYTQTGLGRIYASFVQCHTVVCVIIIATTAKAVKSSNES